MGEKFGGPRGGNLRRRSSSSKGEPAPWKKRKGGVPGSRGERDFRAKEDWKKKKKILKGAFLHCGRLLDENCRRALKLKRWNRTGLRREK